MDNVRIYRPEDDSEVRTIIEPQDKTWQLLIDLKGVPHLHVRVPLRDAPPGTPESGLLDVEELFPDEVSIEGLMQGDAIGGPLPPEEEAAAAQEYLARGNRAPCPRRRA